MTRALKNKQAAAAWPRASDADGACLERQLKRPPRHLAGIARRCAQGFPAVAVNYPLPQSAGDAAFFPTLFWLSCPAAIKILSRWEDEGWIRVWQQRLKSEPALREKMDAAHAEYTRLRQELVAPAERTRLGRQNPRLARELAERGIGGLMPGWTLKCLHLHYAHYLATGHNPVGQWAQSLWNLEKESKHCPGCEVFAAG
jgi:hypothetical protein